MQHLFIFLLLLLANVSFGQTLAQDLNLLIEAGDLVVCLGAGDITAWAAELPGRLEAEG